MPNGTHCSTHGIGAIHGRFQPFHKGHMRYLRLALERADLVYVGITNPDAPKAGLFEDTDPLRHRASHNPLTYLQREHLIQAALAHHVEPIPSNRVRIVRFDVNADPASWHSTIPAEAIQFVAVHEPWDEEKARRFTEAGYGVEFLPTEEDRVTASRVRELIRISDPTWRSLLPAGVPAALESLDLVTQIHLVTETRRSSNAPRPV